VTNAVNLSTVAATGFLRNRIINGAMVIDQRNAGASVTAAASTQNFSVDRWFGLASQSSKYTIQQNAGGVTPPAGFKNYLGVTSSSAYSVTATDFFSVLQIIEGYNIADFDWGTAGAKTITLSFWVRSSLTGTFGGVASNQYTASGRYYPFTYTISAANTWEQKTITIAGDITGTWGSTNGNGIVLQFGLGVGSTYNSAAGSWTGTYTLGATGATSVVGTNGATFYITGVQLEVGTVATPFERRLYGTELALCQRYYFRYSASAAQPYSNFGIGYATSTTNAFVQIKNPVTLRSPASSVEFSAAATFSYSYGTSPTLASNALGVDYTVVQLTGSGMANGYAVPLFGNNSAGAYVGVNSEL
jgi:hypothetical protein